MDHFLRAAAAEHKPRNGTGIAVLVVYSFLLLLMLTTYLRLICTVIINPGYVPRGPQWHDQREKRAKQSGNAKRREKSGGVVANSAAENGSLPGFAYDGGSLGSGFPASRPLSADDASPELRHCYGKEVFTCEGNGKPIWCSSCSTWKPDRAHHCREVGRCVRKMDHFCPWLVHTTRSWLAMKAARHFFTLQGPRFFLEPIFYLRKTHLATLIWLQGRGCRIGDIV